MLNPKMLLSFFFITFIVFASCSQHEEQQVSITKKTEQKVTSSHAREMHQYGGWYCPDNLIGFPAVDVQDIDKIPAINGRLPTKEETQNGTSLMYFDTTILHDAHALNMKMPRLAKYYSDITNKNEWVIVIQAVIVARDTVVGFRYLNGGNGSAWFDQVKFKGEGALEKIKSSHFVTFSETFDAPKEKVWEMLMSTLSAKTLRYSLDENVPKSNKLEAHSKARFKSPPNSLVTVGTVTALWDNLYLQIDSDFDTMHYVEKYLLVEDKKSGKNKLTIVAGPYTNDIQAYNEMWHKWMDKVKELSK